MGGRPLMMFAQLGIPVVSGCPELEIREVVELFLNETLVTGENSCGHGNKVELFIDNIPQICFVPNPKWREFAVWLAESIKRV